MADKKLNIPVIGSRRKEKKYRFSLTLLVAGIILIFMIASVALASLIVYILVRAGILNSADAAELSYKDLIGLMSVVSLTLGAAISFGASFFPLKPVNKFISKMNRLASGDFKARLEIKGALGRHPAVKEVTDSFNTMARELENTEMLREDFINNFSHEFKTPIVSIAGFAKLLKRGELTEEQKAEYVDIIEQESVRLANMATNVLNLTKLENQTILTDICEYNLSEQLRSSILSLEGKWSRKNIELDLQLGEYMIAANRDALGHVWLNLIDNAVKFSDVGGKIGVEVKENDGMVSVSVSNNCEDIPVDKQDRIFNKFYQADESHASEGNGIGLAIVKGVTELHGGQVCLTSENGTTVFTVNLPK
ncbi:MAG: HAMP domain-containing histidine kinase [Clostridia bacterium]|nr:HAMP domain-containing histidine kinase [Clostridia bacterium]